MSERSEFIIFSIFVKNFSKFRTSLDFFFGSFLLYQDKRNEHEWVFENKMLRYNRFKKTVGTGLKTCPYDFSCFFQFNIQYLLFFIIPLLDYLHYKSTNGE
ncbi:MAG: hypothetical protein DRP50_08215 [Thermotoga sp.]|nr:MAG: hypothetical protein DRP50_08215 [Thermotoga sp.]